MKMTKPKQKRKNQTISLETKQNIESQRETEEGLNSFAQEITFMLHALGDVWKPKKETSKLINEIVQNQINKLLAAAAAVAKQRNSDRIGVEEFVFLLRSNPIKLARFVNNARFKDLKSTVSKNMASNEIENIEDSDSTSRMDRIQKCIDQFGMTITIQADSEHTEDGTAKQRAERAEKQTRCMTYDQYLNYSQCRQVTFGKKMVKFRQCFEPVVQQLSCRLDDISWEILAYFAHETVAEIVDVCLLLRQESESDDVNRMIPSLSAPLPPNEADNAWSRLEDLSDLNKKTKKGRKRKLGSGMDDDILGKCAIQPSHVREALRRFQHPLPPTTVKPVLICLR